MLCAKAIKTVFSLTVLLVFGAIVVQSVQAGTFKTLYNFTKQGDGGYPYAGVVPDIAGNLYGTTYDGGSGFGVVFKVTPSGSETALYTFTGSNDGANPAANVYLDRAGNIYGTTYWGGTSQLGVVFKIDPSGNETVLYSFAGGTADGCNPCGCVIADRFGNLYGTTSACGTYGGGTVFKLTKTGDETVVLSFEGGASGGDAPILTELLMDNSGNLYGVTTGGGGTGCNGSGCGTVYELNTSGVLTVLYSFTGSSDGCTPYGQPVMDATGNLYGTTYSCGAHDWGTIWRLNPEGVFSTLHSFSGSTNDGSSPFSSVVLDPKGNLYGSSFWGGSDHDGVVYSLNGGHSDSFSLNVLHSFQDTDGLFPVGSVYRDANGTLFGTTLEGGSGNYGTVWSYK
jgi:uncharacterized repeat protein (TIGR03803 family)